MNTAPTRKRKKATPKTFKAAYDILKTNAAELQQQDEPDIDNLMTTVEESITAYRVCETRINAVQRALDAAFAEEDSTIKSGDDKNSNDS
jgi:exodeoxyribonuclease VII small subunit